MSDFQRLRDFRPDFEQLIQRERTFTKPVEEGFAFEKLHHQVIGAVLRTDVVQMANVGMVERRNRPRLAFEALLDFWIAGKMG